MTKISTLARCIGTATMLTVLGSSISAAGAVVITRPAMSVSPDVKDHCLAHGGVRANPCAVTFTPSSPGPDLVNIRVERDKKDTLVESDNCAGFAIVAAVPSTPDQYSISPGTMIGTCQALFQNVSKRGKVTGYAVVNIDNTI
jgi:hypothetical protein